MIIPNEMKEEIFKPFVRFNEKEDGKVTAGTGIGLALSRSLTELHQGTLVMGKGETNNTFCLTLPMAQDLTITLTPEPEREMDRMNEVPAGETEKKNNRPTVLVVEDNPDMLAFVVRQLSKEFLVLTATNGAEALQMLDGNYVNVERSMMMNGRLDGHIVQGHVDQTAECMDIKDAEGSWYFTFRYAFDKEMAKRGYITVDKGSVTVNGVSLTVCNPTEDTFQVAIIPYTYEHTNFHTFKVGSIVNIEFDIIGKYLSRMMQFS